MTSDVPEKFSYRVESHFNGSRLDQIAAEVFKDFSRARLQQWIKSGQLTVNGVNRKPKDKLIGGETIAFSVVLESEDRWLAQDIPLECVYSDEHIIVINKPAGLVVHPGAGVPNGTLLNALLHHFPELATLPRAGIVHRLDKETSGLMVVAHSLLAHTSLVKQLQDRSVGREYEAIVMGQLTGGGVVNKAIGRHPSNRVKMAVIENSSSAKDAITHYRILNRFPRYTHVACKLETGRTHQIRVHMAYIKHPLVGDPVYLGRQRWLSGTSDQLKSVLADFSRQALHAKKLTLVHPHTKQEFSWQAPLPEDFQHLLAELELEKINNDNTGKVLA
jgi:23S rRNA pseudouridine1911/1915/1917 synthase